MTYLLTVSTSVQHTTRADGHRRDAPDSGHGLTAHLGRKSSREVSEELTEEDSREGCCIIDEQD